MQALEFEVEIDENHQIHLQLPETFKAGSKVRVIILYEESEQPLTFTDFLTEMADTLNNG